MLAYDASGQRVMAVEPAGKTTYFPFPGYSEEMVGTSVTARRVTYTIAGTAVASRVQVVGGSNTLYYLYTDHLGSTVAQSNTTGTITLTPGSRTYYLPYGSYRGTPPTQTLTDRDFTGQRENRELGLLYYNARFYVPSIGRFASADTIVPDPANPQQFNRYTYSLNSPLNYSDPTGHCALSTYLLENAKACWDEGKVGGFAGNFGNHFVVDDKYIIDQRHMKRGHEYATQLLNDISAAIANGGGPVSLTRKKEKYDDYTKTWNISADLPQEAIVGVAYAIYQEFAIGFEAYQGSQPGIEGLSGYAIEDLPSEHLGFWAAVNGVPEDELFSVLEQLGEVETLYIPPYVLGTGTDGGGNVSTGFVKNYTFEPMSLVPHPHRRKYEAFSWPAEFQLQAIRDFYHPQ